MRGQIHPRCFKGTSAANIYLLTVPLYIISEAPAALQTKQMQNKPGGSGRLQEEPGLFQLLSDPHLSSV